jgi:hypothetical protein
MILSSGFNLRPPALTLDSRLAIAEIDNDFSS